MTIQKNFDSEKLIKEARAAIKPTDSIELVRAFEQLATVFEKEFTSTDDEREALARWLHLRYSHLSEFPQSSTWDGLTEPLKTAWRKLAADAPLRRSEEEEWEESIQYGHLLKSGGFIPEYRGINYSTHQRTIKFGPITPIEWEDRVPKTGPDLVREALAADGGTTPSVQGWA